MNKIKKLFSDKHFKHGSYSIVISVVVIAIVIVVNMILNQLPAGIRNLDISSTKIYDIGDTSKNIINNLDKDVKIRIIAQENNIDTRIKRFIEKYADMSDHISVETIDPVLHPSVLEEYDVSENSIVVTCEDTQKSTSFTFSDVIGYDQMSYYYYGQYQETEFDGEGQLTSAIDYVTNDVNKKIYTTEGHGESDLPSAAAELIKKQNFETASVNLLSDGGVPKDCDLLLIYAPSSDLADDEKDLLSEYMEKGGHVMLFMGSAEKETPNLDAFLKTYGIETMDGYIADTERYYQNNPYAVFPEVTGGSEFTEGTSSDELALILNSRGMTLTDPQKDTITVDSIMTTSDSGMQVTEDAQAKGNYVLAASAEDKIDDDTTARLTVFGAASLIDDSITQSFTNLSNLTLFMNSVTANFDDVTNISIEAKSLAVNNNTVQAAGMYAILFIAVIPLIVLIYGFIVWLRRRKA